MSKHGPAPAPSWPLWAKIVASLMIVWHFSCIFFAVTAEGNPPELSRQVYYETHAVQPYLQALFLTNAYRFFAPDPGATGLVWFRVKYKDGVTRWLEIPDADEFVLRMPYQRRLALALSIQQNAMNDPRDPSRRILTPTGRAYLSSYVRHVAYKLNKTRTNADGSTAEVPVESVQVFRVDHGILEPSHIHAGWHHEDLRNYVYFYLGTFLPNGEQMENVIVTDAMIPFAPAEFAAQALVSEVYPVLERKGDLAEAALPPPIRKLLKDFPELANPEIRREIALTALDYPMEQREVLRSELLALAEVPELRRRVVETPPDKFHDFLLHVPRLKDVIVLILEARIFGMIDRYDRPPENQPIPVPSLPNPAEKASPPIPAKAPIRG